MTATKTAKTTKATPAEPTAEPKAEKPVLFYNGKGVKLTVPTRDLYAADLERRSKDALLATGFYTETAPDEAEEPAEAPAEAEEDAE